MTPKRMRALTQVFYAGYEYKPGDSVYPECDLDGRTLEIMGQAEYVIEPPPPVYVKPATTTKPVTVADVKSK